MMLTAQEITWLNTVAGELKVNPPAIRADISVPDIAYGEGTILLGRKFLQHTPNSYVRKKKLVHETLHHTGLPHSQAMRDVGYYSNPDRDRLSEALTDEVLRRHNMKGHNPTPPQTEAHRFVQSYLRERAARGEIERTAEGGQRALQEAWAIARERGLRNPASGNSGPSGVGASSNFHMNPFSKKSEFSFSGRQLEQKYDQAEDHYEALVRRYGPEHALVQQARNQLERLESQILRRQMNPKMPADWYDDLPPGEPVIVREYQRKLPRRKGVPSRETIYKRLKKPVARSVVAEWDTSGKRATVFETARGGGPAGKPRKGRANPDPFYHYGPQSYWPPHGPGSSDTSSRDHWLTGPMSNPKLQKQNRMQTLMLSALALAAVAIFGRPQTAGA